MTNPSSESWRPVVGWEGLYEVSDQGRVRSLDRVVLKSNGVRARHASKLLKPRANRGGYLQVALLKPGTYINPYVHRLVLAAFVGPRPDGCEGCHWNGDQTDNRLSNLRWDTRLANLQDNVRILGGVTWKSRLTHCLRGHLLAEPNLANPSGGRVGRRYCLACKRGRSDVNNAKTAGRPIPDLQEAVERHYRKIMGSSV